MSTLSIISAANFSANLVAAVIIKFIEWLAILYEILGGDTILSFFFGVVNKFE